MNVFKAIGHAFAGLGRLISKALQSSIGKGLTDAVVQAALGYVRTAAAQFPDNDQRRAWVVDQLVTRLKVPESVARIAVELAVRLYKDEVARDAPRS